MVPSVYFSFCLLASSVINFHPDIRGWWWSLFLGLLVQSCCGEAGTLQTNITGVCGECSQCLGHTGFAPAHGLCAFPVYTAQALGCSARNCLRQVLGWVHFPVLSRSGSGSQVLHKGADLIGPAFCALPHPSSSGDQVLGKLQLITSPVPAARFSGCTMGAPFQVCCVSPLGSWSLAATFLADVDHPEFQGVLVSKGACLQFGRWFLSGATIVPFWLWLPCLPVSGGGWAGPQPASSAQSFVPWWLRG